MSHLLLAQAVAGSAGEIGVISTVEAKVVSLLTGVRSAGRALWFHHALKILHHRLSSITSLSA